MIELRLGTRWSANITVVFIVQWESIRPLSRSNPLFTDGTFKSVPRQTLRLFTVHIACAGWYGKLNSILPNVYITVYAARKIDQTHNYYYTKYEQL